jgi:hypothetical protein
MGDFEGRIQMIKLKGRFTCSTGTQTIWSPLVGHLQSWPKVKGRIWAIDNPPAVTDTAFVVTWV